MTPANYCNVADEGAQYEIDLPRVSQKNIFVDTKDDWLTVVEKRFQADGADTTEEKEDNGNNKKDDVGKATSNLVPSITCKLEIFLIANDVVDEIKSDDPGNGVHYVSLPFKKQEFLS